MRHLSAFFVAFVLVVAIISCATGSISATITNSRVFTSNRNTGVHARATPITPPPFAFPSYKQCDPRWGSTEMGVNGPGERATICKEGCAMTSTAMMLSGMGVELEGATVNPGTLNTYLLANNGYYCLAGDCNNLNFTAVMTLTNKVKYIGETQKPPYSQIVANIATDAVVNVAHVRDKTHFVLLTGPTTTTDGSLAFKVHDPYFNQTVYAYSEIADIIRWKYVKYPLYKQCNSSWGSNQMGTNGETICQVGCLMSSTSMAIGGSGISINGQVSDPETLNAFLRANGGYTPYSGMMESVIPKIAPSRIRWPADGMHTKNDIPMTTIKQYLDADVPRIVIANVMHGHHFVLVVGYDDLQPDLLYVNDPGFNRLTYNYSSDVVGWRLFDMIPSY